MIDVTLGIAVLLASGMLFAKLAQLLRLPSVTGYILAGVLLGPSGLSLVTMDSMGHQLDHFNQIALMLIAFGVGEHIELRGLRNVARDVGWISAVQAVCVFLLVFLGVLFVAYLVLPGTSFQYNLILALLLAAISVATAPAVVLHVVREVNARGPLTSTLMALVAAVDGIAIIIFGLTMSATHQIIGQGGGSVLATLGASISEISLSLMAGVITGFLIDLLLGRLHNRGEMLTGGLGLLLLCGELTRLAHLSPLLAGMAAGFTIINRAERDERLFRTINSFEPPVYVLFFTLAGAHLDLSALAAAGWIGLMYLLMRTVGKVGGSWLGASISGAPLLVKNYLGLAMLPQAGVAIGLVFMIASDPPLKAWSMTITPVVLAAVVFFEIVGPLLAKFTLKKAGEAEGEKKLLLASRNWPFLQRFRQKRPNREIASETWPHDRLHPAGSPQGVVLFGAALSTTARGLARVATILAHHYHALPMSVRVLPRDARERERSREDLFSLEEQEVAALGYPLEKEVHFGEPAVELIDAARRGEVHAVVLGYPLSGSSRALDKVLTKVAFQVPCPVVVVHGAASLRFGRVLVPYLFAEELDEVLPLVRALLESCESRLSFLQLLHSDSSRQEIAGAEQALLAWRDDHFFDVRARCRVEAAESRLESILSEARFHDLLVMTAARRRGLQRLLFGSLATAVVRSCTRPVLVVHAPVAGQVSERIRS